MQISLTGGREARADEAALGLLILGSRLAGKAVIGLLRQLLAQSGRHLQVEQVVAAGLRRAWNADGTVTLLNRGWDLVLLVESAMRICRAPERYEATARVLGVAAHAAGCRVALVEPPTAVATDAQWRRTEDAVCAAAEAAHAEVLPVGRAWRLALAEQPGLPLQTPQGRMAVLGAYLVACTIARFLSGAESQALAVPGVAPEWIDLVHRTVQEAFGHAVPAT